MEETDTVQPMLVLCMPTRHRAEVAALSARLILESDRTDFRILLSDNSTDPEEQERLAAWCRSHPDERLHYIRPAEPLSMSGHLDWLFRQALERFPDATHFSGLWDRMTVRADAITSLVQVARVYPEHVCSFHWDAVHDAEHPITIWQHPWTGRLMEVASAHILWLASEIREKYAPKLTNCLLPRHIFQRVIDRYGDLCDSITADICFGYRCLTVIDSLLVYDRAHYITYALNRSNAAAQIKGQPNAATRDFLATLNRAGTALNFAAPIPELAVAGNQTLHEYCLVRQAAPEGLLPPVNMERYLKQMAEEVSILRSVEFKREMEQVLARYGAIYNNRNTNAYPVEHSTDYTYSSETNRPEDPGKKVTISRLSAVKQVFRSAPTKSLWLWLARVTGIGLPGGHSFQFDTVEAALNCARHHPRRKIADTAHLSDLLPFTERVRTLSTDFVQNSD